MTSVTFIYSDDVHHAYIEIVMSKNDLSVKMYLGSGSPMKNGVLGIIA